jgi:hypothetical protein
MDENFFYCENNFNFFKAYRSVGCFGTSCGTDVFKELLDYATCQKMAAITPGTCYTSCADPGYLFGSYSMTIEMCLQACISHGYTLASINKSHFRNI